MFDMTAGEFEGLKAASVREGDETFEVDTVLF